MHAFSRATCARHSRFGSFESRLSPFASWAKLRNPLCNFGNTLKREAFEMWHLLRMRCALGNAFSPCTLTSSGLPMYQVSVFDLSLKKTSTNLSTQDRRKTFWALNAESNLRLIRRVFLSTSKRLLPNYLSTKKPWRFCQVINEQDFFEWLCFAADETCEIDNRKRSPKPTMSNSVVNRTRRKQDNLALFYNSKIKIHARRAL